MTPSGHYSNFKSVGNSQISRPSVLFAQPLLVKQSTVLILQNVLQRKIFQKQRRNNFKEGDFGQNICFIPQITLLLHRVSLLPRYDGIVYV